MKQWKNLWGIKMTNNTLKPCPFCGCKQINSSRGNMFDTHCPGCKARAINDQVWNTRHTDKRILEVLRPFAEQREIVIESKHITKYGESNDN